MYILHDNFNNRIISRHRTLDAAVKAQNKYSKRIKRINGNNAYLPMKITENGKDINYYELIAAEQRVLSY